MERGHSGPLKSLKKKIKGTKAIITQAGRGAVSFVCKRLAHTTTGLERARTSAALRAYTGSYCLPHYILLLPFNLTSSASLILLSLSAEKAAFTT